jgi:hypothetical protein
LKEGYEIRLVSIAAVVALGSYAVLLPKPAIAADCSDIGTPTGTASASVSVPTSGTYRIWSQLMAPNSTANSLLVTVDNQCRKLGDTPLTPSVWSWVGHQNGDAAAQATVALTAGDHTVKLTGIEAGVKVNKLLLLADTSCVPRDNGDNCTQLPTPPTDTQAPSTPASLKATITSATAISLSWMASTDNIGVVAYDVYRSTGTNAPAKVATVAEPLFHDGNLAAATTYSYYVVARDAAGNQSAASTSVLAKTLAKNLAGKGKLYGKVTFSQDNAPTATVSFAVNGSVQSYPTDGAGYYFITDIPAGTYMMKYQAGASVKYAEIKIKSSGDTIKDMTLPKVTVQPPIVQQPFAFVDLASATLADGATFVTESDTTTSILLGTISNPDPDPDPNPTTGCSTVPSACGYPDATNTGYKPTGVTLTTDGVTINQDGDFVITEAGAIIDGKQINGCVIVKAPNVTIKRSFITNCQSYFNIRMYPEGANFTLEDTEIDGNNVDSQNAAIVDDGQGPVTIRRMYVHNVTDGPHPGEHWLIEDSYITDLYACAICHNDTIQSAGARDVTLRHNTIVNTPEDNPSGEGGKNAVVRIATEQGPVNGFVIENNLLSGGNFAVQVREQGNGYPQGVIIRNNRIVPNWRFGAYDFGPNYISDTVQLSGNFRDDNSAALNTY